MFLQFGTFFGFRQENSFFFYVHTSKICCVNHLRLASSWKDFHPVDHIALSNLTHLPMPFNTSTSIFEASSVQMVRKNS